jgi:hypothetical protein
VDAAVLRTGAAAADQFSIDNFQFIMPTHYFTVAEANALLPQISRMIGDMLEARQRILEAQADLWPVLEKAIGNGGSKKAGELLAEFSRVEQGARQLSELGCILKDVNTGLVDFPTIRNGREAFLCWQQGEPEIAFWHDVDAGFAGRQPLDN